MAEWKFYSNSLYGYKNLLFNFFLNFVSINWTDKLFKEINTVTGDNFHPVPKIQCMNSFETHSFLCYTS